MRARTGLAGVVVAVGLVLYTAVASFAANWGPIASHTDCSGNGCLTVHYRIDMDHTYGFYLEGVTISAANGGITYQGAAGKGASCWNDNNVIQWSKGADATSLNPGQSKTWDLENSMPNTTKLVCGWYWRDVFVPGTDINQCAKVLVRHSDWSTGGC